MDISVTERQIWKRCRRQWDLQSFNRQALARLDAAPNQFSIGTALHLAFSSSASGLDPRVVVQHWLLREEERILNKVPGREIDEELKQKLLDARNLSLNLVDHYFSYWGWDNPLHKQGLEYIAAEVPLRAEIPGTDGHLVGTLDGIAIDAYGQYWIVEHKTYSQRPNRADMDTNDQMTAYTWLFQQVFGFLPAGVLYDGVGKKLPTQPRLLAAGGMSKQWIDTTATVYLRALLDADLDPRDYAEILARLEDRDNQEQNPFFTRWLVDVLPGAITSFGEYLPQEYLEMHWANTQFPPGTDVRVSMKYLYPNFRWDGCWDCSAKDLCKAIQFREDFEFVRDTFYVQAGAYETLASKKIERGDLEDIYELHKHVPNILRTLGYVP